MGRTNRLEMGFNRNLHLLQLPYSERTFLLSIFFLRGFNGVPIDRMRWTRKNSTHHKSLAPWKSPADHSTHYTMEPSSKKVVRRWKPTNIYHENPTRDFLSNNTSNLPFLLVPFPKMSRLTMFNHAFLVFVFGWLGLVIGFFGTGTLISFSVSSLGSSG